MRRVLRGIAICVLPILASLDAATNTFGGSALPWRPNMVDLEVYRKAGAVLLQGGDFYNLPGQLQFLYPPFAAVLAAPLALLPRVVVQLAWTVAGALAVLAVLHRFGLNGWRLCLVGTGAIYLTAPVIQTSAFGQLGIFLVALVVLDLVPGPRVFSRRVLPQGTLTALAAAIKLTPAIFVVYLLAVRRWRAAVTAVAVGLAVTVLSAVIVPGPSLSFWTRLAHGDTGLGHSLIYYTNQSVMADVVRVLGLGHGAALLGLALSGVVALLGVWVGVLWHRLGDLAMAVNLCGLASLLASPVSWLHHFVWIVPLAMSLAQRRTPEARLPGWFSAQGWFFVGWVVASPFNRLPHGADLELLWTGSDNALASVTAVSGTALIVTGIIAAQRRRLGRSTAAPAPGETVTSAR
ncbi:MAG: putative glycosyltransferase [Friedmanniella sp.]|nr:putative glycosyltransferase [Friedmanniella sp.]